MHMFMLEVLLIIHHSFMVLRELVYLWFHPEHQCLQDVSLPVGQVVPIAFLEKSTQPTKTIHQDPFSNTYIYIDIQYISNYHQLSPCLFWQITSTNEDWVSFTWPNCGRNHLCGALLLPEGRREALTSAHGIMGVAKMCWNERAICWHIYV